MPTVIENVEKIIKERGLKKKYVAAKAGLTSQQFSELLGGKRVFKAEDVSALAQALSVSPNDLFKETNQHHQ